MNKFSYDAIEEYQLEITTYCNAACPQCPRNVNGGKVNPYLNVCHLDSNIIDKAFPEDLCRRLTQVFFCGSYGDPIMHPDFHKILYDFRDKAPNLHLYIHTNGGVHDKAWWEQTALLLGKNGKIDFGIDGLEDTNHLYRRNVKFEKVIANAKAFIDAGGKAQWNWLVYKHNEHQIPEAKKLAEEMGFDDILFRATGRFMDHKTLTTMEKWPVENKKGEIEYYLEPPTDEQYHNASVVNLPKLHKEYPDIKDYFDETKVKCDALVGKKVTITAEGLVLPCNFFEHNLFDARFRGNDFFPNSNANHFEDGFNQVEKFIEKHNSVTTVEGDVKEGLLNIHKTSLKEVFKNPFWNELVDSWSKKLDNGKIFECALTCGQKLSKVWDQNKKMTKTYKYYITGNNRGLGLELNKHFDGDGCSRGSGLDITRDDDALHIAKQSLYYDVFINNAFDGPPDEVWGNYGQVKVLMEVFKLWKFHKKTGWIFNIGSSGVDGSYTIPKAALDKASEECSKAFKRNEVKFKTTIIRPGRLDTPLSRSRATWTGNGIKCLDLAKFIEYAVEVNPNTIIEDITFGLDAEWNNG